MKGIRGKREKGSRRFAVFPEKRYLMTMFEEKEGLGGIGQSSIDLNFEPSAFARECLFVRECCGHFYCNDLYFVQRNSTGCYLLVYLKMGVFYYHDPEREEIRYCKPEDFIIVDCTKPHIYGVLDEAEFYWMQVSGPGLSELMYAIIRRKGAVLTGEAGDRMNAFLKSSFNLAETGIPTTETEFSLKLHEALYSLTENPQNENYRRKGSAEVMSAITYVAENYTNPKLSVKMIAEHVHISETQLNRLFRAEYQTTPYRYLFEYRLRRAKIELDRGTKTVKEVAFDTGWGSEANFVCAFRRATGITPGKWHENGSTYGFI